MRETGREGCKVVLRGIADGDLVEEVLQVVLSDAVKTNDALCRC